MSNAFLPTSAQPLLDAIRDGEVCLDILRDLLLNIHAESHNPARVRHLVAEALEQQETAWRTLRLENGETGA